MKKIKDKLKAIYYLLRGGNHIVYVKENHEHCFRAFRPAMIRM